MKNNMERTLTRLVLEQPFWAMLALRLRVEADETIDTAATNGVFLKYNTAFFDSLSEPQRLGLVAHEVAHCALQHMTRRAGRDMNDWNEACDFVVNLDMIKAGFELPDGALVDWQFDGMAAEQVFAKRSVKKEQEGNTGKPDPNGKNFGAVEDAPTSNPEDGDPADDVIGNVEADWKVAVMQAEMLAKKAGTLPEGISMSLAAAAQSQTDWRDTIQQYIQTIGDYSFARPNRRHLDGEFMLPGTVAARVPTVVVAIDTSGSVYVREVQDIFRAELEAILNAGEWPERVVVMYIDSAVQHSNECPDGELIFEPKGGGGTAFQPAFDWLEAEGIEPTVMFYLTDLENGGERLTEPGYPVVWIAPESHRHLTGAFGETVYIPIF